MPPIGVLNASLMPDFSQFLSVTGGQSVSFDFVLEIDLMLLEEDSYRWPKGLSKSSAGSVSPIGNPLSHTAKSKSDKAYERVLEILREIDFCDY